MGASPPRPQDIDVLRNALCSRMLLIETIWMTATKRFRHGYFPCCAGQCSDTNAAKPSCPNGPVFGFEEGHGHTGYRRAGAATGPAVGNEWQPGHLGQYDGVGCLPVTTGGVGDQYQLPSKPGSCFFETCQPPLRSYRNVPKAEFEVAC